MAAKLKLIFDGDGGKKVSMTFACADVEAGSALVKTLMQEIVANGDIYAETPLAPVSAAFAINTTLPVNID